VKHHSQRNSHAERFFQMPVVVRNARTIKEVQVRFEVLAKFAHVAFEA
jgi:hypothetical protein